MFPLSNCNLNDYSMVSSFCRIFRCQNGHATTVFKPAGQKLISLAVPTGVWRSTEMVYSTFLDRELVALQLQDTRMQYLLLVLALQFDQYNF